MDSTYIFRNTYVYTNTYTHAITIDEKVAMNLKENLKGHLKRMEGGKGRNKYQK